VAADVERTKLACPNCAVQLSVPRGKLGLLVICPKCHVQFEATENLVPESQVIVVEVPRKPGTQEADVPPPSWAHYDIGKGVASNKGMVCSVLSVIFACIAFLFCPPLFGLAGVTLGIVGLCLCENKTTAIVGIVLSVVGTAVGMMIGIALMSAR